MSTDGRPKILVVDDNAATRYSTARILRQANYATVEAGTGSEALLLMSPSVDLVVLDINLPDLDGFEVCRRIRERPEVSRTPVVHLSATFTKPEDYAHGLEAGADGYLTHPVEPIVLTSTISAFLRTRDAEDLMRAGEARFRAVFDRAQNAMTLVDEDGRYVEVNPAFCRLVGRERDALVGLAARTLLPGSVGAERDAALAALSETGEWRGVMPILHKDGTEREVEWTSSMLPSGGIRLAIGMDITERRLLERDRERLLASEQAARAEAERANRLKDEFLATLSHELRNPLNAILGWAQMLPRGRTDPDLLRGLATIERNARVQAQLISDLLDVSRITSGKLRLDVVSLDPSTVVEAALEVVAPAAEAKGIRLRSALAHGESHVLADADRLQQVVWNLVANAIKFTPKGGEVRVVLQKVDSSIELRVEDDGSGISPEFLPHIFERFRQETAGTRKSHGGLGLGLAIVKHLVEMHGGTVAVYSEGEGRGATFTATLPLATERAAIGPGSPDAAGPLGACPLDGVSVVVVEDDPDARELVCRVLLEAGAQTHPAPDAETAVGLVETLGPGILVSDIGMANRDGYDLIRELRAKGHTSQSLPAIALTAFARMEDRRDALLAGYQNHLTKPVDPTELIAAVAALAGVSPRA